MMCGFCGCLLLAATPACGQGTQNIFKNLAKGFRTNLQEVTETAPRASLQMGQIEKAAGMAIPNATVPVIETGKLNATVTRFVNNHKNLLFKVQTTLGVSPRKAAANLPYYITTPVLFRLLGDPHCRSVTVMVQREVAERMTAKAGGKDYGALSVAVQLSGEARITRSVGRHMFDPPPNVDSAVVHIEKYSEPVGENVKKLVRAAFSMRRKTLVNCLTGNGYDKNATLSALGEMGLDPAVRGERLTPRQFAELAEKL